MPFGACSEQRRAVNSAVPEGCQHYHSRRVLISFAARRDDVSSLSSCDALAPGIHGGLGAVG